MSVRARHSVRHASPVRWSAPPPAIEQMSPVLDSLSLKFVIEAGRADRFLLDLGCGAGLASLAALERGGRVIAVDPDLRSLEVLRARVPAQQHPRCKLRVGRLPEIDFKAAPFSAIHVGRMLHFLNGAAIQCSLRKAFRWLYPDGKLFISALTPAGSAWMPFHAEYRRRLRDGLAWPGYIEDLSRFYALPDAGIHGRSNNSRSNNSRINNGRINAVHLLDEHILGRELVAAGFKVEEAGCYELPWDHEQMCCAVVATCSV